MPAKTNKNILIFSLSAIFFIAIFFVSSSLAAVNRQMNYQGKLTDLSNVVMADGNYDMVFKIYDADTAGNLLWTGTYTAANGNPVELSKGIFSIMLGSGTGNELNLDFSGSTYYLGVTVSPDVAEMAPRKILGSVPQAFNSLNVIGDGYINIDNTSTAQDAASINYDPSNGTNSALSVVYGSSGGTGTALNVVQAGSGFALRVNDDGTATDTTPFIVNADGNVGIGTTSPTGFLTMSSSGVDRVTFGTAGMGGSKTNMNLYDSAGNLASRISTSLDSYLNGSGVGNVGIGTTNPGAKLEVNGNISISGTTLGLIKGTNTSIGYKFDVLPGDDGTGNSLKMTTFSDIGLYTYDTTAGNYLERMRIKKDSGNVGIGTSTPTNLLDVAGGVKIGAGYAGIGTTAPLNGLLVQGNVGIGTTSPGAPLNVVSSGTNGGGWSGTANVKIGQIDTINAWSYGVNANATENVPAFNPPASVGIKGTASSSRGIAYGGYFGATATNGGVAYGLVVESGNVGIGNTAPSALLSVGATSQFQVNSSGNVTAGTYNGVTISGNGTLATGAGPYTLTLTGTGSVEGTNTGDQDLSGLGGAPNTSKYILQQADAALPNAQALGALGNGIVKNTTTTGVLSIAAAGTDYIAGGVGVANQVSYFTSQGVLAGSDNFWFNGTNVGIGTTSPGAMLDVRGTFAAGTNGTEFFVSSAGDLTGGSYNKVTITAPLNSATLTIADQKTLTVNNSLTFSGEDAKTINFGSNSLTFTTLGDSSLTLPISGTLIANPMTTLGDIIYGGASGAPTSLAGAVGFLKSTGSAAPSWSTIALADVSVPVTGSPSVVTNLNTAYDYMWSAGVTSGGDITDNGNGTVSIASGEAMLRTSASATAPLKSITFPASNNISLTDNATNYTWVDYNGGNPIIATSTVSSDYNCLNKCHLYTVVREGTELSILDGRQQNIDANRKQRKKYYETDPFDHVLGGTAIGNSGRYVTVSAGAFYYSLNKVTHNAFDTSVAGTSTDRVFDAHYRDGSGGWTHVEGEKQIDNTQYDDGDGGLGTLTASYYGVHWVYLVLGETPKLAVVYGRGNHASLNDAKAEGTPQDLPPSVSGAGVLIGRLIIQKSNSTIDLVESAFSNTFSPSGIAYHSALAGLDADDHTQYMLLGGRTSGQTLIGGLGTTDNLILRTTGGNAASGANMIFQTGNNGQTEAMRILYNGNVGIGTTNPSQIFQINGSAAAAFVVTAAGQVGIGTTSPLANLSVAAATGDKASLNVASSSAVDPSAPNIGDLWFNGTNLFFRKDGSTNADLLSSAGNQWINSSLGIYFGSDVSGNVGIGTATPDAVLEINGGSREITGLKISNLDLANYAIDLSAAGVSGATDYYIYVDSATTYWRADGAFKTPNSVTASSFIGYENSSYYLDPGNATTSLLVAGNVGIGTLSPDNSLSLNKQNGDPILDFRIADATQFSLGVDDSDSDKFKIEYGSALGNENPALVINSANQVGLGTYNQDNTLTLNEPVGTDTVLDFKNGDTTKFAIGLDDSDSDNFKIETGATIGGGTPAFVINSSSGNVGIGTATTGTLLTVNGGHFTFGPLNSTTAAELRFLEGSDNGTDYIGLKGPASVDASLVFTLPSVDGTPNQILQTNGSQVLSWSDNAVAGMSNPMTTTGDLIYSSSGSTPARRSIGTANQCLIVSGGLPVWGSCPAAGTGVAGLTTQVQFNNAGAFGANADFTWDNTNKVLSAVGSFTGAKVSLALRNAAAGAANSNELRIGNDTAADALLLKMTSSNFTTYPNYAYIYNKTANGLMLFGTNNLERMRIEAGGNVGIGITAATSAKLHILDNTVTAGNGILATTASLGAGNLMFLQSTSTAAASNTQTVLKIDTSGANGTATQTTYGIYATNTHSGTTATNVGGYFSATSVSAGSVSYSLQTGAMTGEISNGLNIGALSGTVTNIGVNIGNISAGATADYGIQVGTIVGAGTGAALVTGAISSTGANAYQLNLGAISGANATQHTGVAIGAISGTTATAYGLTTSTVSGASAANVAISTGAVSGTATNNYGVIVGTVTGGTTANYGEYISTVTTTGATNSYGAFINTMSGTGAGKYGFYLNAITSSAASTNNVGMYIGAISGSVVATTTNQGIQIASIAGGATNNYGINMGTVSGGTTSNQAIVTGAVSGTATNNYGVNIGTVTGGTSGNYGLNVQAVTGINGATNAGINVAAVAGPTSSTVYGINVAAPTATGAASYGMKITGPTGAATSNYGLDIVVPTGATHNSALVIGTVPTTSGTWALYSSAANNSYFAGNVGFGTVSPGSAADVKGTLRLSGATSGYVGLVAAAAAGSATYTLPSADGTNGQVLMTSGAGVLSWTTNAAANMTNPMTAVGDMIYGSTAATPSAPQKLIIGANGQCLTSNGTIPVWGSCSGTSNVAGSNTQVQFNSGGLFGASANFVWDNTNYTLSSLGTYVGSKVSLALRNIDTGETSANELRIGNNTAADTLTFSVNSSANTNGANNAYIMNRQNAPLIIGTNNTERVRILSNGNVGVGTTNPQAKLHVNGKTQIEAISTTVSGNGAIIDFKRTLDNWNPAKIEQLGSAGGAGYGGVLTFSTNGLELNTLTERMRIDAYGNIGIGTAAPTAKLHILDTTVTTGNSIYAATTSLTTGTFAYLISNTTAARANQTVLNVTNTGTNDAGSITTYGMQVSNTHSGTLPTNVAAIFTATGGLYNYGVRVGAMTGPLNYGLDVGTLSGNAYNYGLNIGNISAGSVVDYAINIGTISGGGTGAALVSGTVSSTGANAYQLALGGITGNNATAHYGISTGAISGITGTNYGISVGSMTGATANNYGVLVGSINTTGTTSSYEVYANTMTGSGANKYAFYSSGITSTNTGTNAGLYLGAISGSIGASTNTGVQVTSIAGTSANAYGLNIGTITGAMTANYGVNIGAITSTGATNSYGMYQAAIAGTGLSKYAFYSAGLTSTTTSTNNIGIYMGAISGSTAGTTNTGLQIGNVSGVALNNYGINLGTLTGGTTANYQLNLGAVTAVAAATNYGINIGGIAGAAVSSNNYGIKIASLTSSGTGTANYGMNIVQPAGATHDAALEIGTPAIGTGDWSIYSSVTAQSYFAGNIGIGISVPVSPLHIKSTTAAAIQIDPFGVVAGNAGEMRFLELATNGTNYVGFKSPDSIATNRIWILPNADGSDGQILRTNGSQVLSWTNNSASGMANPMLAVGDMIYASVAGTPATPQKITIGANGQCLNSNGTIPFWGSCSGTSVAAGSSTYIQFNNGSGTFGASADFTWDDGAAAKTLSSLGSIDNTKISLALLNSSSGIYASNELRIGNDTAADIFALSVNSSANTSGANFAYIMNRQSAPLILGTDNTERIRILSNGNVGIGSTNPVAMLDVFGISAFGSGTVSTPSIAFRTSLDTGIWSSAADTINFTTNSQERMRIDTNGNVGIGTTLPSMLLDVGGTAWLRGAPLGQAGVYVKNDGNVGIGSTNPVALLDVFGTAAFGSGTEAAPSIVFRTSLNTGLWSSGTNTMNFSTNGTERVRMDANGNVGIGHSAPVGRLVVMGAGVSDAFSIRTMNSEKTETFSVLDNGNVGIGTSAPLGPFQIGLSPTPALLVTSNGNVGMGTTSPNNKLQIVMTSPPTADIVNISNAGFGVTNTGVSALQVNYVGGDAAIEASSIRSDITPGGVIGGTWNAIRLVGNSAASGVSLNALKIDNLTPGSGTETAITIGTGWDYGIFSATSGVSYFAGNVGIGTSNPLNQFHIYSGNSGANPSMLLAGNAGGDTDFWLSRVNDGGNDDDDFFQIGDGTVPGTNPFLTINTLGNVGIGTVSPASLLHLNGGHLTLGPLNDSTAAEFRMREGATNGTNFIGLKSPDALGGDYTFTWPSDYGTNNYVLSTNGSGGLTWVTGSGTGMTDPMTTAGDLIYRNTSNATDRLGVGAAGKILTATDVGGTIVPQWVTAPAGLTIGGDDAPVGQLQYRSSGNFAANDFFYLDPTNYELYVIGAKVGAKNLSLRNTNNGNGSSSGINIGNDTAANTFALSVNSSTNLAGAHNAYITNTQAGPLIFGTTNLERMRILAGGNIGIGTTNPGAMLEAVNNALTTTKIVNLSSLSTTTTTGSLLYATSATAGLVATNGIASLNATGNYTSTANVGLLSVVANATTAGTIQNIQGNALATGFGLVISSSSANVTSGSLLYLTSATTSNVATNGIVSLNATGNYLSTANVGLLNLTANATTGGTIQNIQGNALTTGQALNISGTGGLTTGSLIYATSATAGALATNGIVSINATGNYTSSSSLIGALSVQANATVAGTLANITGNALTTGQALRIASTGTGLTSGSLLYINSATTGAVATNGIASLIATGNYSSTSNIGLLSLQADATTGGTIQNIRGNGLTTGSGLVISSTSTGLTTGNLLYITSATTGAVATNGIVSLNATGAYTSTSDVGLLNVTANATLTGTLANMTGNALTSGKILNLSSSSAAFTGTMANLTLSGNNAANTGTLLKVTSSGASNTGTPLMVTNLGAGYAFRVNDETGDTDATPFVIDASGNVGIGVTMPAAKLVIQGTASEAVLGSEMISNLVDRDFSGAGNWSTGSGSWTLVGNAWSHTALGNSTSLANTFLTTPPVAGNTYKITFTVSTTVAGTLTPSFGGTSCSAIGQATGTLAAYTCVVTANSAGALFFTPSAAWVGTLDSISVMLVNPSNSLANLYNSNGTVGLEIRSGGSGLSNSFIGTSTGMNTTTGSDNSALGSSALYSNTTGSRNSALGLRALYSNTTGSNNSALGSYALYSNTTGSDNSALGYDALYSNTTGSNNSALGRYALYSNTTGSNNSALGYNVLLFNTTGSYNTALGFSAGYNNSAGSSNVFLGYKAGYNETGSNKLWIANSDTTSLIYGDFSTGMVGIGGTAASTSPYMYISSGGNVGIGTTNPGALLSVGVVGPTGTDGNILMSSATTGQTAGSSLTWNQSVSGGVTNSVLARLQPLAGDPNVNGGLGNKLNFYVGAWNNNNSAGNPVITLASNGNVGIGTTAPGHILDLGNGTYADSGGAWHDASDIRYKKDITDLPYGLAEIMQLQTISYVNTTGYDKRQLGFSAQQVQGIIPELVDETNGRLSFAYGRIAPVLTKAIQEQQSLITQNTQHITQLDLNISQNNQTTSELQTAVNDKLAIISQSLALGDESSRTLGAKTDELETKLTEAQTKLAENENNLAAFQTATNDTLSAMLETENMITAKILNHEDRIKALEDKIATVTVAGGEIPANVVTQDVSGNVTLAGIFKAKDVQADGIVAGTVDTKTATVTNLDAKQSSSEESVSGLYSVKTQDIETSSLGEAEIAKVDRNENGSVLAAGTGSDGKSVFVKTKAVSENSQVFVTSKTMLDQPLIVTEIKPGEGFKVAIKNPSDENIKFAWWVVESR